jgi:predicted anti-sigma-YlaC factor YlaD
MRDTHIIRMLEEKPFGSLSEIEISNTESHISHCSECRRAYDAARISASLVLAQTSEGVEAGPFFTTGVMATLRERHLSPEGPALVRMWRAAGAVVLAMAALVVILVGLTVFSQGSDSQIQPAAITASQDVYSPEYVVLEQGDLDDGDMVSDQLIATMYDLGDADEQ